MNKKQLIDAINDDGSNCGVSKVTIDWVLGTLATVVHQELADNGEVTLPGLVKLSVTQRAERQGRNPQTGESIIIPAARVPKVKVLKAFKDGIV